MWSDYITWRKVKSLDRIDVHSRRQRCLATRMMQNKSTNRSTRELPRTSLILHVNQDADDSYLDKTASVSSVPVNTIVSARLRALQHAALWKKTTAV